MVIVPFVFICLWACSLGYKAPHIRQRTTLGSIALVYRMENMVGKGGIEWESPKLELLGSRTEGSMSAGI